METNLKSYSYSDSEPEFACIIRNLLRPHRRIPLQHDGSFYYGQGIKLVVHEEESLGSLVELIWCGK